MDEFLTEGAKKIPTLAGEAIGIIFLSLAPKKHLPLISMKLSAINGKGSAVNRTLDGSTYPG
jgi:hypothetical protein